NQSVPLASFNIDTPNDEDDMIYNNVDETEGNDLPYSTQLLHPYTSIYTDAFCQRIFYLFRESKLSKREHRKFLDLINDALPIPNNLASNMNRLLSMIQMKVNLFRKRRICLICTYEIANDVCFCPLCPKSNDTNIAIVYDSDIKSIVSLLLKKHYEKIRQYKKQIRANHDEPNNDDISFGYAYQKLLQKYSDENFITALMHLDGISLCKSNKLKMWLFSFSIVEILGKMRYQRYNMAIVSICISSKEPVASIWLQNGVAALEELKVSGIVNFLLIKIVVEL
ncbi:unnamed protein product, partial [Rotaria sp. Silwood2]